jgi:hypothetical protein
MVLIRRRGPLRRGYGYKAHYGGALAAFALMAMTGEAAAEFKLRSPDVEDGERAIEFNGSHGFDGSAVKRGEQSYTLEVESAINSWWLLELEGEGGRNPGPDDRTRFTAVAWENIFQLTEPGKYWADVGVFAEYGRALSHHAADAVVAGPLIRKVIGRTVDTLNIFINKDVGGHASGRATLSAAWQTRLTLDSPLIEPGVEIYSQPGALAHFSSLQQQDHRAGPVLFGEIETGRASVVKYELGYLFGLTRAAPAGTAKWRLEYEFRF